MKHLVYIIVFITSFGFAQSGFEKGNVLYQKGQYEQAIQAYESVLDSHQQSAELYFNLGNCYYKLHQVAPSIYNYEKALVLSPDDVDITNNLKFAHKLTIDEVKEVPKVGFAKLLRDFTGMYHFNTWACISIVFGFLFLGFFIGYYFSPATLYKRIFFIGMFLWLIFLFLSIGAGIFEKNHFINERPAIVFAEVSEVKSEPQKGSPATFILHEGTKVFVEETLGKWKKIELTDGTEGWIENEAIREVK
ncbi:BatE protein [Flavobacterium ammoniigenes]|jgi:tetratricopeptide (TPR) repeat protein|uniref:BatE protein n=1 Tax=Flavobacterium ammoniigenes TaxID=1751095 RepID=A0ABM7V479_9FLAO|nr:tetratricopeptide repeat protein [Flavobacterium ammoniigenes]BDB54350.1 BatE protein [Flavobacterium ammoniigenes]